MLDILRSPQVANRIIEQSMSRPIRINCKRPGCIRPHSAPRRAGLFLTKCTGCSTSTRRKCQDRALHDKSRRDVNNTLMRPTPNALWRYALEPSDLAFTFQKTEAKNLPLERFFDPWVTVLSITH